MTLKQKTVNGLMWSFIDNMAGQGSNFIIGIILARLLVLPDFGLVGMVTIFIAVSQSFIDSGFSQPNKDLKKKHEFHKSVFDIRFYYWGKYCKKNEIKEKLIGFIWAYPRVFLEENRIYINALIIDKKYRGRGFGQMLVEEVEKYARENNIFVVDVSTASFKEEAINFYEKIGYVSERVQLRKSLKKT